MTTIDTSSSPTDRRASQIAGLRELADFLDAHPAVPFPLSLTCSVRYAPDDIAVAAIAQWVAGLGEVEQEIRSCGDHALLRHFAGLTVSLTVKCEDIGTATEVVKAVTEWTPFTVDELLERAAAEVPA